MTAICMLLCLLTGQAGPPPSPIGYEIAAFVLPDGGGLGARATIRLNRAVLGPGVDSIHLGLGEPGQRLRLAGSPLVGNRVAGFVLSPDSTEIVLALDTGDIVNVELAYRVDADMSGRRQLGYDLYWGTGDDAWYPRLRLVRDSVRRFSDYDVTLTAPRDVAVLTSGAQRDSSRVATGIRRRVVAGHVEGFALALAPRYLVTVSRAPGVTVRAISPAEDTATFRRVTEETARAASWYRATYGLFPASEIGIIPGVEGARGGFPLANLFMIHRGDLSEGFVRWITAHELAHYYWGLYVLGSGERLDWLMLGLGIWTDQLYLARSGGRALEAQWRDPHADNSFEDLAVAAIAGYDQRLGLPESYADSLEYDYNTYVRHAKGAVAVYLLARRAGADAFVRLQRALLGEFRNRPLSPPEFAARLEGVGVSGATDFVDRWVRADARVDYAIRGVRPDSGSPATQWILVERTGTISFPITLEAVATTGAGARATLPGEAALDSVRVTLDGPLASIRLDPDGVLPLANSGNVDMRRVYLRAMGVAGPAEAFVQLAHAHLERDPDPLVAALLVERLFELGRYAEIRAAVRELPSVRQCGDRVTCLAALQVARALARLGDRDDARDLLDQVGPAMKAFGLAGSRRLAAARNEIGADR